MAGQRIALGLMSGTSLDGIDAAILQTDGTVVTAHGPRLEVAYGAALRDELLALLGGDGDPVAIGRSLTLAHADVINLLLSKNSLTSEDINIIGFPGQTIRHDPARRRSWQIGDGRLLARLVGVDVVDDFRSADVAAGGEGAPLAPLYHAALAADLEKPVAVLNIGGVGNVTWIGSDGELVAFDTGPGNAMIDDWVRRRTGERMDAGGRLAAAGTVDRAALAQMMDNPYFDRAPPKSLDRNQFALPTTVGLEAGAATLTEFTAHAVLAGQRHFPVPPRRWLVTGGGRHNPALMAALRRLLTAPVDPVERVGWRGDVLEAEAFAYLAVRSLMHLPISLPTTTGVPRPMSGGRLNRASVEPGP